MPVRAEPTLGRATRRRRPAFFAAIAIGSALSMIVVQACSLDFTVRPDPGDVGSPDATDALVDRGEDATTDGGDSTTEGSTGVDCGALLSEVDTKLKAARACTLASGHCQQTVKDQCDCDVVIAVSGSAQVASYADAVTRLKKSNCALGCGASCPATLNRNCLQKGGIVECYPP